MSFIAILLLSAIIIAMTSLITYEILGHVWNVLPRMTVSRYQWDIRTQGKTP